MHQTVDVGFDVGPIPDEVHWRVPLDIQIWLQNTDNPGIFDGGDGGLIPLYIVYDAPVSPQVNPWLGVLDDSTVWAEYENVEGKINKKLTFGLNDSGIFEYSSGTSYSPTSNGSSARSSFKLRKFLSDRMMIPRAGNCYDVSNYLCICFASLGLDRKVTYAWIGQDQGSQAFTTKPLRAIGKTAYTTEHWNNHQFTVKERYTSTEEYVRAFDACLSLQTNISVMSLNWNGEDRFGSWGSGWLWRFGLGNQSVELISCGKDADPYLKNSNTNDYYLIQTPAVLPGAMRYDTSPVSVLMAP